MMLGQKRPFTARQNIGIVLARVQLTRIRCDGDTVNWLAETVKCSCWYSLRFLNWWSGSSAKRTMQQRAGGRCINTVTERWAGFAKVTHAPFQGVISPSQNPLTCSERVQGEHAALKYPPCLCPLLYFLATPAFPCCLLWMQLGARPVLTFSFGCKVGGAGSHLLHPAVHLELLPSSQGTSARFTSHSTASNLIISNGVNFELEMKQKKKKPFTQLLAFMCFKKK